MAELYPPGIQRIFYRATSDADLVITAKILDPHLVPNYYFEFTKVLETERIYFTDVNLYMEGIWLAVFYEDFLEKAVQAYNTKKIPSVSSIRNVSGNVLNRSG